MRTILALLGAAIGYGIGIFVSDHVCAAIGVPDNPTAVPGALIILACGAVFCVLGIRLAHRLASVPGGRARRTKSRHKWQATFAALGTAIGPVIGYFAVYSLNPSGRSELHAPVDLVARLFFGAPTGAILFYLLGLYLGSALDAWSARNDTPQA